jgi:hypothetical protein
MLDPARPHMDELDILHRLDLALRAGSRDRRLAATIARVEQNLTDSPSSVLAWEPIPLDAFTRLPDDVASAWVFALRAGCTTGAERHPNSRQRVMSLRGVGDLQMWTNGRWQSNTLEGDAGLPAAQRWLSIPPLVWHRPVIPASGDWTVVSFHTVPSSELIEERAVDDNAPDRGSRSIELYEGRASR